MNQAARRIALRLALILTGVLLAGAPAASAVAAAPSSTSTAATNVIVRTVGGSNRAAEAAVTRAGGTVTQTMDTLHSFIATVPERAIAMLRGTSGVASVTVDLRVSLSSYNGPDGTDPADLGSLRSVVQMIGADTYWRAGYTGAGVDVAVIDSGVAPVEGLSTPGKVVNGPDLSFESQDPDLRYLDTYGHGTHMAGIIAGNDTGAGMPTSGFNNSSLLPTVAARPKDSNGSKDITPFDPNQTSDFMGVAPGARIVSLKVADAFGATDVSQVLAAIDWVIAHRHDGDANLNIRVLNLSFGTDGTQAYALDPLSFAVEQAWKKGIFVVVSAGNEGYGTTKLNDPAYDPYIMAVGASDPEGTANPADDTVATFSSGGDASRHPDVVAPGTSIGSLRDPGSYIDTTYPTARFGDTQRLFRGSGTSQATAVVSGAAALIIQQRPWVTPDQLKLLLSETATPLTGPRPTADGNGQVNLAAAYTTYTPSARDARQDYTPSTGLGTLDGSRGSFRLVDNGVALTGNTDIFGNPINVKRWAKLSADGNAWDKGAWMGVDYTGRSWTGRSWTGIEWAGRSWTDVSWSGRSWTSDAWQGRSWTGRSWTDGAWTGRSWTNGTWSGNVWSSSTWGT